MTDWKLVGGVSLIGLTMGWLGSRLIPVKDNPKTVPAIEKDDDLNWGGDPDGQLAKALAKARQDSKKPRKPLEIVRLDSETFEADPSWNELMAMLKQREQYEQHKKEQQKRMRNQRAKERRELKKHLKSQGLTEEEIKDYMKGLARERRYKVAETFEAESDEIEIKYYMESHNEAKNQHKYYIAFEKGTDSYTAHGRLPGYGRETTIKVNKQPNHEKMLEMAFKKMNTYRVKDQIPSEIRRKLEIELNSSSSPPKSEPKEEVKEETVDERDYNPYERMLRRRMKKGAETFVADDDDDDDDDDGFKPTNWNKIDGCKYCGDSWCDYLDGTGLCPVKHSDQMDAETFEQKIPPFTDNDMWTKWVNEEQNVYPLGAYGSGQSLLTPIKNGKPLKESGSIFNIPEEYFNFNYDSAKKIQIKWKEILKLAKKNDFVNWDESIYHLPTMKRAFKNLPKDTDIEIAIVNKYIPCRITFNYEGQDWYYSQSPYLEWWEQDEVKKLQRRMRDGIDKEPEFDPDFDPVKADRNKDGKISDWEKAVGNAVAKGIREHKEGKEAESFEAVVVNRGKQPKGALGKAVLNQRMIEQSKVMAILEELENKVRLGLVDEKQLMGDLKRRFGAESTPVTETDKYDEIASRFTLMELEIALVQTLNKKDMKSANEIMKVIQRKKFINEYQAENNEGR